MVELTVIVPTYNGSLYLDATLTSIHGQRGVKVDVIVVDDGSTDDSVAIAQAHSVQAQVLTQSNAGVAVARNRGLAEASSRWVAFLDQDDLWHVDRAATLLELADRTGANAVATTEQAFALNSDRVALELIGDGRADWPSHWLETEGEISALLGEDVGGTDEIEALTLRRLMAAPATVTTALMYDRRATIAAGGCAPFRARRG